MAKEVTYVKVSLDETQHDIIKAKADALGLKVSQFIRLAALTGGDIAGSGSIIHQVKVDD
jgi:hypothetical protein